jgi:hypothetical protein
MPASELAENPRNWRAHPDDQRRAMAGLLREIGQVGELYAWRSERDGGRLTLIDGHLRAALDSRAEWDVAITDLTDEEADKLLLLRDPLAGMARANGEALALLAGSVSCDDAALRELAGSLSPAAGGEEDAPPPEPDAGGRHAVLVTCADEAQQREVFEELQSRGWDCRLLVV